MGQPVRQVGLVQFKQRRASLIASAVVIILLIFLTSYQSLSLA